MVCTGLSPVWVTELIQVLSRDMLSVHWARAATHWDGACPSDVSIIKQHLRYFERRENHGPRGRAAPRRFG